MEFIISAATIAVCFWLWMRYQDTDEWKWLAIGAAVLVFGIFVSNQVRGPAAPGTVYADECDSFRFRGNECY